MAYLVAGLPAFFGFSEFTWVALVGHLLFGWVAAADPFAPRLIRTAGLIREVLSASEIVRRGEALERSSKLLAYQVRIR